MIFFYPIFSLFKYSQDDKMLARTLSKLSLTARTQSRAFSEAVAALPPNLKLEDDSLFGPEKTERAANTGSRASFVENKYSSFMPLHFDDKVDVMSFATPGTVVESDGIALEGEIFAAPIRKDIVHEMVRYQRAKIRQPNRSKRVGEISGSKKKPLPQKGGGNSQVGNKRNSSWRGGMKAHGPVLRDFAFDLNRKYKAQGLMISLAAKYREGNLHVFDNISVESNKTRELMHLLYKHGFDDDTKILLVENLFSDDTVLASRNLKNVHVQPQLKVNVYDLLKVDKLAISAEALENITARIMEQYTHQGKSRFQNVQSTLLKSTKELL